MLRLYKNLRASDCILIVLIVGITVLQVFLTIQLTDQISAIVGAIQCLSLIHI